MPSRTCIAAVAVALAVLTLASGAAASSPAPPGPEGPSIERGPALAPPSSPPPGGSVDGIECQSREQVLYHVHARLTVYVDGRSRQVPPGIGIADPQAQLTSAGAFVVSGICFSWLHTHAADGVIHIESPSRRTYTLGEFFDVWGQPLDGSRAGAAKGRVTAYLDGKPWHGDPRSIPLRAHAQIQLDVGRPLVAPTRITHWYGL